jgi:hypothetical protein
MTHLLLKNVSHRPWLLPRWPWALAMSWRELLFMHWPVHPSLLRDYIPSALEIDTFDGSAWIGVVPFLMADVRPRSTPSLPWISAFAELNVRTYVTVGGKPGVWFFSLDAANPLAVRVARASYNLPYFDARMHVDRIGENITYTSARTHRGAVEAAFRARYRATGPVFYAQPGSIDHWLTERYCLYAANKRGRVARGDIHHDPWPLQPAEADVALNTMTRQLGFDLPDIPPLLHFARRLDVVAWLPQRA